MNTCAAQGGPAAAQLRDMCTRISSGGTPSRQRTDYFRTDGEGHLWVKSKELLDRSIGETEEQITDEALQNSSARYYPAHTILVAMYGANAGQLGWLKRPATVNQAVCGMVVNEAIANYAYVFYALLARRSELVTQAQGAAQQNLNQDLIRGFRVPLPGVPTQRKIAAILSAYDDLIENNRRRIQILEETAQLIYREWFVHFRFPGHESVRMVDSPLGPIPEGWEVHNLGDVIELAYGKGLRKSDRVPGPYPVYGSSGVIGRHRKSLVTGPGIVVGRKGNVGSVFWSHDDFYPIDTVFYVVTDVCLHYIFYNLRRQNFINTDAAVPGLKRSQAYLLPFLLPDKQLLERFERITDPVFMHTRDLRMVNATLRRTRDLLLPRLISGQIDVSDLDIDTGELDQ